MKKLVLFLAATVLGLASASAKTVYFNAEGTTWNPVYAYSWTPDVAKECTKVTVDGKELWSITLDNAKVIFRSTLSQWGDDKQTNDLDVVDNAVYGVSNIKSTTGNNTEAIANIEDGKYVPVVPEVDEYPAMYLVGQVNGWSASKAYKMKTTDGITYTLTTSIPEGGTSNGFKFFGGSWGTRELTVPGDNDTEVKEGQQYSLAAGGKNMYFATGVENVTFTLVQSNDFANATLTIGDLKVEYQDLYIRGGNFGWAPEDCKEANKLTFNGEDTYTITLDKNALNNEDGWKIAGNDWNSSWVFGMSSEETFNQNANNNAWNSTKSINFPAVVDADAEEIVVRLQVPAAAAMLDASTPAILSFDFKVGVAAIEAETAEAVYYNLQGVRVANPEKGLYIKVVGNKAAKIVR